MEKLRAEGRKVSSLHLRFLQPMPSGLGKIMRGFKRVMTVEGNWSDRPDDAIIDEGNRRFSSAALMLRARYLIDIDCCSEVRGQAIKPGSIRRAILEKLSARPGGEGAPPHRSPMRSRT